jgi:N12 class adenine-specific DNA methylase
MHKWLIRFKDGKTATMLSHDCPDLESALAAAVERFGANRIDAVTDGEVKPE